MNERIVREITPLSEDDFFIVLNHYQAKFDFPIHYHPEFELNMVLNSKGKRIIGDSILEYNELDLVLIGPNTPHAWAGSSCESTQVVTVQFHNDFIGEKMLERKLMYPIRELLEKANRGILFSQDTAISIKDRILKLSESQDFDSLLDFLSILYDLSISRNQKVLATPSYLGQYNTTKSRRIEKVNEYIQQNLHQSIKIKEVADIVNMSETAFSHFFKKRTQRSFSDYITDMRVGNTARQLIETEKSISEICYDCGFNNISNFNRIFKKKIGLTPTDFRSQQRLITKH
jgi:AraC-like DNA-binding protein/quercetin dioxygenase-like cupin family protein